MVEKFTLKQIRNIKGLTQAELAKLADNDFWPDDMSGMRFEDDYTRLINTLYPAWSMEEYFIDHMNKQGEPYLYFKPEETFDGQPHIFKFEIVTEQQGNEWYRYLGVK